MTISETCTTLGVDQPCKPSHAAKVCDDCGSDDLYWIAECTLFSPEGTGYDAEFCGGCGKPTGERKWVGR